MENQKLDKTIYNEFEQKLIDNGYHFDVDMWKHSIRLIQRRIQDKKGTKYFINAYHYNIERQYPGRGDEHNEGDRYMFTAQFTNEKEGRTVNVDFSSDFIPNKHDNPVTTLEQVEEFFEKVFVNFNFDYYEKD